MKILLVDDEIDFISTLAERLSFRGIEVDWVSKPEEALILIDNGCYDIAVLDIKMPRIGGLSLKKQLQKKCPAMHFIFLTGHGSEESFKAGISEAGINNFLLKPVRFEDLLEKIQEIDGKDRQEDKHHE